MLQTPRIKEFVYVVTLFSLLTGHLFSLLTFLPHTFRPPFVLHISHILVILTQIVAKQHNYGLSL